MVLRLIGLFVGRLFGDTVGQRGFAFSDIRLKSVCRLWRTSRRLLQYLCFSQCQLPGNTKSVVEPCILFGERIGVQWHKDLSTH